MPANLTTHQPITVVQTTTNTTEQTQMYPELAGQTFPFGAVIQLAASGFTQIWTGTSTPAAPTILGISMQPGFNLGTNAAGIPPSFGSVGAPGSPTTYGTVPGQPLAVNIPAGATFADGRTNVAKAVTTTIFRGQFDNSAGAVAADYTPTIADVGIQYGLHQSSADMTFYVDKGQNTVGTNACVTIVALDPNTLAVGNALSSVINGNVYFVFNSTFTQVQK
jgi:hypothetical protein